jgi:phenylacetate-CoA ligase
MMLKGDFFDELETMSPEKRERYFNQKLSETIEFSYQTAPSVKELFHRAGVKPSEIRCIKDLEKLPITRKAELIELQRARPPFGGLLSMQPGEVKWVAISPGPIYEPARAIKIEWFDRAFYAAGFSKGDIVLNTFTYHLSPAGITMQESLENLGVTVVPTGTGNTEIQVQTLRDLKINGFLGTASFLMAIIERAETMGYNFRRDFSLRRAWITGEMVPASLRKRFEEGYGLSTFQAYAVTETGNAIAYECKEKMGMHLSPDHIVEIVNPETGKQLGPGEVGEIVVTPLHRSTLSLIRFGTGDLSSYTEESCPCGRTSNRLTGILGRTGEAVKVRGMFVVAKQAEQVFSDFDQISNFQILVGRQAQRDEMIFKVELKDESIDKAKLADELSSKFQGLCRLKPDRIDFVAKGTIPEKHETMVDERKWD